MKTLDLTQPGGFPLTQDRLDYLQTAYRECLGAIGSAISDGDYVPALTGMVSSDAGGGITTISEGYFFYNNEVVYFPEQSYTAAEEGNILYIVITGSATSLTFNDGVSRDVILDKVGIVSELPLSTPTDETHFRLYFLRSFALALGLNNRTAEGAISVSTPSADGGVIGNIFYRKDKIANTLSIRSVLIPNNPENIVASPNNDYVFAATLPVGYRPTFAQYITGHYSGTVRRKDDVDVDYLNQISVQINPSGAIHVRWIKPAAAATVFGINITGIIPLH